MVNPEDGSTLSVAEKMITSMMPTQNCGIPWNASEIVETARPIRLFGRRAATTPSGKPTAIVTIIALIARVIVAGSRPSAAAIAGTCSRWESPKSSRTASMR